eukprot:tig00021038_g17591.t1
MEACHEAMGNPAVLHHEAPANELFTRLRMKPELAEKYGTGRAAENSFQALKQVAAVLEQMGSKSDVLTHRMLNGGNDSGEEYPEVDELARRHTGELHGKSNSQTARDNWSMWTSMLRRMCLRHTRGETSLYG